MFFRRKKPIAPLVDIKDKHQKIDKIHVLKRCQLFKMLSDWELSSISRLTRIVEFKKDEIVYKHGGEASSFYVVVSGRFEAYTGASVSRQVLAYIKQGGHFGEMSLLSAEGVHTATVHSLSDGLVLEIGKDDFRKIVENNAAISLEISRIFNARLRVQGVPNRSQLHLTRSDIIAVYSAHRRLGQTSFSVNLAASLHHETGQKTLLIDMSQSGNVVFEKLQIGKRTDLSTFEDLEKGVESAIASHLVGHPSGIDILNLATGEVTGRAVGLTTHLLNRLSVDFRFIVVELPNKIDELVTSVMAQSDQLFFVTDNNMANVTEVKELIQELGTVAASLDKTKIVINEALLGFSPTRAAKEELFGARDCFFLPSSPTETRTTGPEALLVLSHPDHDYSKIVRLIARKVTKNVIGIALGSGAALGFAHIGVLKVLERERIPVDMIAGSSMGALIAAFYATGRSAADCEAIALKMNKLNLSSKIDMSFLPIRGLIKGRRFEKYFEEYLHEATFENTKIPLTIVSMSLNSRREIIMQNGLISQAVRASVAIPGVFHPMVIDGDTLVDGGIIDPLPIRPLAEMGANKIIAVDVLPTSADVLEKRRWKDELEKRMDAKMKNKNIFARTAYNTRKAMQEALSPNMLDIIVNSIQTMEHEMAEALSAEADILIRPSMPLSNWTEFHKAKEIIEQGERAAEAKVEELKALVKQQSL